MLLSKKKKDPKEEALKKELAEAQRDLETAYKSFEYVLDPDLIDSCIYQVNAIWHRYKYLLKEAKKLGLVN